MNRKILTLCCLTTVLLLLSNPSAATAYAYQGLLLWFERMVPTLFPFMMVSGILVSYGLLSDVLALFRPVLRLFFRLPDAGLYTILVGFLCGFPMGAKTVADLYGRGSLSLAEAQYLLGFTNNIGPVYFVSFAYPLLAQIAPEHTLALPACLFGMYGIPFIYGIVTRKKLESGNAKQKKLHRSGVPAVQEAAGMSFDAIVTNNLEALLKLAGYMIFFNMLMVWLHTFHAHRIINRTALSVCSLLFEISGGLNGLKNTGDKSPLLSVLGFVALQFGGISCIFQTGAMTARTPLSIKAYVRTKIILTGLTGFYYFLLLLFCRMLWEVR